MNNKSKTIIDALKSMCRTEEGDVAGPLIPLYVVIDHGSADVLGTHLDRKKAEESRDDIISAYPYTVVEETYIDIAEIVDALSDAGVLNLH